MRHLKSQLGVSFERRGSVSEMEAMWRITTVLQTAISTQIGHQTAKMDDGAPSLKVRAEDVGY
jgi:hypothetical protein